MRDKQSIVAVSSDSRAISQLEHGDIHSTISSDQIHQSDELKLESLTIHLSY